MTVVRQIIGSKQIKSVVSARPDETVADAAMVLARHGIGALIVTLDGRTVEGIISERDIVRALGIEGTGCLRKAISEIMTTPVVGCHPDDTANSVMERMTEGRFRHMPVIEGGRMIGVISIGDVVKARIDEIQHENSALADMIANSW